MATNSSSAPFINVCNKELSIDEYHSVYDKVKSISASWKSFAISLRLRITDINAIEACSHGNAISYLQKVIEHWLMKNYDYERYGWPCWRMVCVAVKEGGGNSALADEIALEHPMPATTGGATPHPLPATTGGATPHPLPATTGGATPHPLPATTGATPHPLPATTGATPHPLPATTGATPHPLPATTGGATPHPLPATTGGATPHPLPATTGGATPHPLPATTGGATPHSLPATTGATPHSVDGPTDGIHGMSISRASRGTKSCELVLNRGPLSPVYATNQLPNLEEICDEFVTLLYETRISLEKQQLPNIIDFIEVQVMLLLNPKDQTPENKELVRKEFHHIKDMQQLFYVLEKFVSWFNYSLLLKIGKVFIQKNKSLKKSWSGYESKIRDYFTMGEGWAIQCVDAVAFGLTDIPDAKAMIIEVKRDDYTFYDLTMIYHQVPSAFKIPNVRLYFSSVTMSKECLKLNYFIPNYLYFILFPINEEQLQNLASINEISKLECGEYSYNINEGSEQQVQHSFSEVDICDPLWYENTSTPLHEAAWRGLKDEVQWLLNKFGYSTYHRGLHGWTPLHSASYGGHLEILQLLIHQYGIDPNEGDDNSVSSIHMASYKGNLSIVKYLVDTCDVPPDQPDNSNNTALLYSAMGGHSDLVEFFIKRNCNTSHINCVGASLSLLACQSGKLKLIHKLESLNLFSQDSSDFYEFSILHYSSMHDNVQLFRYLFIKYPLSIDVKDRHGRTPLHIASWYASSSVVEYIVSIKGNEALLVNDNGSCYSSLHQACNVAIKITAGAVYSKLMAQGDQPFITNSYDTVINQNVNFMKRKERVNFFSSLLNKASICPNFNINATTTGGLSLLHFASWSGSILLVKALEEYNISCTEDNSKLSPVHYAAWSGSTSVLSYIISHYNLNANDTDTAGRTPLVYSCQSGSINCVKYLINNHKSDPNITDKCGMTCLHYSCRHGHIDITQYLIEVQRCDINKTDKAGRTLVHHAAWSGNFDLVQYLITEQGLSPTAVTKDGFTALHYASVSLNLSLVKELITTYQLDSHQTDNNGMLPIHYAAQSGDILLLELYVKDNKHSLNLTDDNGWNVIHYSSSRGHTHFIKYITSQYPESANSLIYSTDKKGEMPLHYAQENNHNQLVRFLKNIKREIQEKARCVTQ
uniref:Uncharacterized protein n=1 Tax=Amphimedon queenslandica TaxID=400682 RepID=A0A1X7UML9_AMPQE